MDNCQGDGNSNHLINENSPYLLLHAHNPIDWYPWGKEAFEKAVSENKPVFLSIGYTTCHWCHVMEKESFSDEVIGGLINKSMVAIKVDREERPDIDSVYMNVSQLLTGNGGWPLNIIMTPDKIPFFAVTYIPRNSRNGRIGLIDLIKNVEHAWKNNRSELLNSANSVMTALNRIKDISYSGDEITENVHTGAFNSLKNSFDSEYGGFGTSPKFPSPQNIIFLIRYWKRTENKSALSMVLCSLRNMRNGGIYDHVGFGFHRYSTDREWKVPHFEKMLHDQAMLVLAYTEAYTAVKEGDLKNTAEEVLEFVNQDLKSINGAFFSSLDADTEGEEGKYYIWKYNEIMEVLGTGADDLIKLFNIKENGNFKNDAISESTGDNIFYLDNTHSGSNKKSGINNAFIYEAWTDKFRVSLLKVRKKRTQPYIDDKILTDWNGLMIAAFSRAGRVFTNKKYIETAEAASDFFLNNMLNDDGSIFHVYRFGDRGVIANLDDYSFLIYGFLELYRTDFKIKYLEAAVNFTLYVINNFLDKKTGIFYFTPDNGEVLIIRERKSFDNAYPSGNSIMLHNLLLLSHATGNPFYKDAAGKLIKGFSVIIKKYPMAHTMMLASHSFNLSSPLEIVIVGNPDSGDTKKMLDAVNRLYIPNMVVLFKDTNDNRLAKIAPFTEPYTELDNKATAYVCRNFSCKLPVNDIDTMIKLIKNV